MAKDLELIGDRILGYPVTPEKSSALTVQYKEEEFADRAEIFTLGDGEDCKRFKEGQVVLFDPSQGLLMKFEGEDYYLFEPKHVVAILKEKHIRRSDLKKQGLLADNEKLF